MPATARRPRPAELLGGPWATSFPAWLLGSLALVLTAPALGTLTGAPADAAATTVALEWLLATVVLVAARLTVFRNARTTPVALPWVVAFVIMLGAARLAAIILMARGDTGPLHTWSGMGTAVVAVIPGTAVFFVLITYVLAINEWYAGERARLLRFEVDAEATRLRSAGALAAARTVATKRIRDDLDERLTLLDTATSRDAGPDLPDALLDAASASVRPASHALWAQGHAPPAPRLRFRPLEQASLAAPLPMLLPFLLWAVIVLPSIAIKSSWPSAALTALLLLAGIVVFYPLGTAGIRHLAPPPHFIRARIISIAAMVAATVPALAQRALDTPDGAEAFGASPWLRLSLFVPVVAFTLLVGWVQAALRIKEDDIRALRTQVERTEMERMALEEATERMQHDLARHLHSNVQAGLVASAYAIQDAVNRGDQVALEHAIAEARMAVARVDADEAPAPSVDLSSLAQAIDATWQGMVSITWHLTGVTPSAEVVQRIGNVVQECLANASIHGAASEATVWVSADDPSGDVTVKVADNGTGLSEGAPGLGSAVLTEATGGDWTIAPAPTGGAEVRAVITA